MSSPARSDRAAKAWVVLALVASVAALYAPTARHEFVGYDDGSYVTRNPHVANGLSLANLRWAFTEFHSANWHPLTWLSHQLDAELFGLAPGPHHLVNAALHALNAALCFLFFARATRALWPSALVALVFAVHPQRVESVAWISERKDLLAGVFFFLALLAHERCVRAPSRARRVAVVLAALLGLLAKPMLVTLPLVLLLVDRWPLARATPLTPRLGEQLPLLALAALSAAVTLVAQRAAGAVSTLETLDLSARLATAVLGTWSYLAQAFWPAGLAFFYPHPALVAPESFDPAGARVWLGALALLALTLGLWRLRARAPAALVGWGWTLGMLLPVIGLVQVGTQAYADRYVYLPFVGLTAGLVFGLLALVPARVARALFALGLLACAGFALVARRQVATWRDDATLCVRALAVTERNDKAHQLLGDYHHRRGELELARAQYEAALVLRPNHHAVRSNLGAVLVQLGDPARGRAELVEALRLAPGYEDALLNLGWLAEREDRPEEALERYRAAAASHPSSRDAWAKVGELAYALARFEEARTAGERVLALEPTRAEAHAALAWTELELGERVTATQRFAAARTRAPELATLGEAWLAASEPPATRSATRARASLARLAPGSAPRWLERRVEAAVLAAEQRFDEAARAAAEAAGLAPRAWFERLQRELDLYRARRALGD
jgi:tetratricopeptide (TPR) repeat protein